MKLGQRVKRVDSTGELASKPGKHQCLAHFHKIIFICYQFGNTLRYIQKI